MKEEFIKKITENERIIFKVCRMFCYNREDQQDLFQDIILQLWRSFSGFKNQSKISTWIYRIALNTAITQLRKEKNKPQQEDIGNHILQIASTNTEEDESFDQMMKAINMLSNIEKAIMVLYMEEQSYREIAEVIGISESNVGFKINQIKSKLKKIVNHTAHGV